MADDEVLLNNSQHTDESLFLTKTEMPCSYDINHKIDKNE